MNLPPARLAAIESVLGGCISDPEYLAKVRPKLDSSHFADEADRLVFDAVQTAADRNPNYSPIEVEEALTPSGLLKLQPGIVVDLIGKGGLLLNAVVHARIVRGHAERARAFQELEGAWVELGALDLGKPDSLDTWLASTRDRFEGLGEINESDRYSSKLLTMQELFALSPMEPLVSGVLQKGGLGVLYGAPATGKTFLALDLAKAICTGGSWAERETGDGGVVYIAAEGVCGLRKRVKALTNGEGALDESSSIRFRVECIELTKKEECLAFSRDVASQLATPALIVIDTLSRCFEGEDENNAKDMTLLIAGCDLIRQETGAAVLLVHHTTKGGDQERGSSVVRGAADVMMQAKGSRGAGFKLRYTKVKDGEMPDSVNFTLEGVVTGEADGQEETSCVVRFGGKSQGPLRQNHLEVLRLVRDGQGDGGTPVYVGSGGTSFSKPSFNRHLKHLEREGYIDRSSAGNRKLCALTDKGRQAIG